MSSAGKINAAGKREDHWFIQGDATTACQSIQPEIPYILHDVYFVNHETFVFDNTINTDEPVKIDWPFHDGFSTFSTIRDTTATIILPTPMTASSKWLSPNCLMSALS